MPPDNDTFLRRRLNHLHGTRIGKIFLDKKFAHYTWIGIFISLLNIFLIWLLIDVFGIPTIISSTIVVGGTFILRYILFSIYKVL